MKSYTTTHHNPPPQRISYSTFYDTPKFKDGDMHEDYELEDRREKQAQQEYLNERVDENKTNC